MSNIKKNQRTTNHPITPKPEYSDIILYNTPEGNIRVEVMYGDETFWLTQKRMAELFGVEVHTINYHKEIFKSGELEEGSTIRKIRIVQTEGSRQVEREVVFYNLDVIIAVGYRVNSYQAHNFAFGQPKHCGSLLLKDLYWMTSTLNRASNSGRIILTNCWNASVRSGPVSEDFIKKSPTSMLFRPITTKTRP